MKVEKNQKKVAFLQLFCIFFLLIAFVLTSSMVLFMTYLKNSMEISLNDANIRIAAIVTFGNVFFLSLICAAVDMLRRRLTVERPVKRIIEGAQKALQNNCRLTPPACVREAIAQYRADNDWMAHFLTDSCVEETGAEAKSGELYASYRASMSWATGV